MSDEKTKYYYHKEMEPKGSTRFLKIPHGGKGEVIDITTQAECNELNRSAGVSQVDACGAAFAADHDAWEQFELQRGFNNFMADVFTDGAYHDEDFLVGDVGEVH